MTACLLQLWPMPSTWFTATCLKYIVLHLIYNLLITFESKRKSFIRSKFFISIPYCCDINCGLTTSVHGSCLRFSTFSEQATPQKLLGQAVCMHETFQEKLYTFYIATLCRLFCKLSSVLRQKLYAFGSDIHITVQCLVCICQAVDARWVYIFWLHVTLARAFFYLFSWVHIYLKMFYSLSSVRCLQTFEFFCSFLYSCFLLTDLMRYITYWNQFE